MKITPLTVAAFATLAAGLAALYLINSSNFVEASYAMLVAAGLDIAALIASRGGMDEETRRVRVTGAFTAFGAAVGFFTLPTMNAISPYLIVLPLAYALACAFSLSQVVRGIRMPTAVNGLVIPALYITGFFNPYAVAGWLILSSALLVSSLDIRLPSGRKRSKGDVHIDDVSVPSGFEPIKDM